MIGSLVMLLEWLAARDGGAAFAEAASLIDGALCAAYADGKLVPYEAGGSDGTQAIMTRVLANL